MDSKKLENFGKQGNTKIGNTSRTIVLPRRKVIVANSAKKNRGCKGCSRRRSNV